MAKLLGTVIFILLIVGSSFDVAQAKVMISELEWKSDYHMALWRAKSEGKIALFYFTRPGHMQVAQDEFENDTLSNEQVRKHLQEMVLISVPVSYTVQYNNAPKQLQSFPDYDRLRDLPGVALVDYRNKNSPFYAKVISAYPFINHAYTLAPIYKPFKAWSATTLLALLQDIPMGTLLERDVALSKHPSVSGTYFELVPNGSLIAINNADWENIHLTNKARQRVGRKPLAYSHHLSLGCRGHAAWMDGRNNLSHASGVRENIAMGYYNASAIVNMWINSSGHYNNMINGSSNYIGVASHNDYWCQRFQ